MPEIVDPREARFASIALLHFRASIPSVPHTGPIAEDRTTVWKYDHFSLLCSGAGAGGALAQPFPSRIAAETRQRV